MNIYYVIPLLMVLLLPLSLVYPVYSSNSYTVPGDFLSIQEAINSVGEGSVIYIEPGVYYENLIVNKSVSLIGTRYSEVVIDGNMSDNVIEVYAENVVINNLTIRNTGDVSHSIGVYIGSSSVTIARCIFDNLHRGIYTPGGTNITVYRNRFDKFTFGILFTGNSHNNNITGNIFQGPSYMAVRLLGNYDDIVRDNMFYNSALDIPSSYNLIVENNTVNDEPLLYYENMDGGYISGRVGEVIINYCTDITVDNVTVENSYYGVYISHSDNISVVESSFKHDFSGIYIDRSSNITIESNYIDSNNGLGIFIYKTYNSSILDNMIVKGGTGIFLSRSSDNLVMNNTVYDNKYGISIFESMNNLIYHNDFIDNNIQVRFLDDENYTNIWDNGYPDGGNFWSDYTGVDEYSGENQDISGSDGIGDEPYTINEYNVDHYPLMQHLFEIPDISVSIISIIALIIVVAFILRRRI